MSKEATEALRREALCEQAQAIMGHGRSLNEASRVLGEPLTNLHRYLRAYRTGGFDALFPNYSGRGRRKPAAAMAKEKPPYRRRNLYLWLPLPLAATLEEAIRDLGCDEEAFIRAAIREKLARLGREKGVLA